MVNASHYLILGTMFVGSVGLLGLAFWIKHNVEHPKPKRH